jgi:hypothetical protein
MVSQCSRRAIRVLPRPAETQQSLGWLGPDRTQYPLGKVGLGLPDRRWARWTSREPFCLLWRRTHGNSFRPLPMTALYAPTNSLSASTSLARLGWSDRTSRHAARAHDDEATPIGVGGRCPLATRTVGLRPGCDAQPRLQRTLKGRAEGRRQPPGRSSAWPKDRPVEVRLPGDRLRQRQATELGLKLRPGSPDQANPQTRYRPADTAKRVSASRIRPGALQTPSPARAPGLPLADSRPYVSSAARS